MKVRFGNVVYWLLSGMGVFMVLMGLMAHDHGMTMFFIALGLLSFVFGKLARYLFSGEW